MKFNGSFGWGGGIHITICQNISVIYMKSLLISFKAAHHKLHISLNLYCLTTFCLVYLQKNKKSNPKRQCDYFSNLCMMHPVGVTLECIMFSITDNKHTQKIELCVTTNSVTHFFRNNTPSLQCMNIEDNKVQVTTIIHLKNIRNSH